MFLLGDSLEWLRQINDESINCVITSPPYWGLRDYKVGGQLGLEPTYSEYINRLVGIFDEVKRVLTPDGSCWVVLGDTYSATHTGGHKSSKSTIGANRPEAQEFRQTKQIDLPNKTLCQIPQRFAIAMIDRGWILRNDLIWHKRNCMPSSAKDRFTIDYEHVYFFVKSKSNPKYMTLKKPLQRCLSEVDKVWIAAMVDTEGTIGIRKSVYKRYNAAFGPYVIVANTHKPLLERLVQLTGKGNIRNTTRKTNFECYIWELSHHHAVSLLIEIYPYLIQKKEQAKVAIELQKTNRQRGAPKGHYGGNTWMPQSEINEKNRLWELIKSLNQRKTSSSSIPEPDLRKYVGCEDYYFKTQYEPYSEATMKEFGQDYTGQGLKEYDDNHVQNPSDVKRRIIKSLMPPIGGVKQCPDNRTYSGNTPPFQFGRIMRATWTINTKPFREAHFAVFPPKLVERMIDAGAPPDGIVLDPFAGSGTTCMVAKNMGRRWIGIELNENYIKIAKKRLTS